MSNMLVPEWKHRPTGSFSWCPDGGYKRVQLGWRTEKLLIGGSSSRQFVQRGDHIEVEGGWYTSSNVTLFEG